MRNNSLWARIKAKFGKKTKHVAILQLHGVIGMHAGMRRAQSLSLNALKKDIDKAFSVPKLNAVALSINSPGGSPVQSELIYKYLKRQSKKFKVPVYSFIEDVGASGGYFLAVSGSKIYASESSIVGSLGVISYGFGFVNALKKLGIERRVITQGKNKSILDPFIAMKEEDVKIVKSVQKDVYEHFKNVVREGRDKRLSGSDEEVFSGKFWSGKQSVKLGLIDGIGDVYEVMEELYGKDIKFHTFEKEESWIKKKLGLSADLDSGALEQLAHVVLEKFSFAKFGL